MMGPGNGMGTGRMTGQIDAHFIEQMIPHHEDAITMADLAMDKAEHQEIRQLAEDITRTQSEEIEQMKTWYKGWFGKDVPDTFTGASMMHMGMMGGTMDIDSLENATDFDKEFIEQMIPHHQMAVMMATMLQNSTGRPEMQQLAENIVEAQTREIDAMREWYRQWYE
jgi:uncharacterized protein (DUF305 family)